MSINNSFSFERIKKALSVRIIAIVMVLVAVMSIIFYISIENHESCQALIWFVTTESDDVFSDECLRLINDYGNSKGIDKVLLTKRHPDDQYFDVAMSTSAYYNCDIFVMKKEFALKYADLDMFLTLSDDGLNEDKMLYAGDNAVGLLMDEDYYFLINARTDIDLEVVYGIYDILIDELSVGK